MSSHWDPGLNRYVRDCETQPDHAAVPTWQAQAQAWCDEHGAVWQRSYIPVRPGELAVHAPRAEGQLTVRGVDPPRPAQR